MRLVSHIFVLVILIGQINLPLYWHICSETGGVSFLSSCENCAPSVQRISCCEEAGKTTAGIKEPAHSCCEISFAKVHSQDATPAGASPAPESPLTDGCPPVTVHDSVMTSAVCFLGNVSSPAESPPIYLSNSSFRI